MKTRQGAPAELVVIRPFHRSPTPHDRPRPITTPSHHLRERSLPPNLTVVPLKASELFR